jgi:hypothetical protein
MTQTLGPTSTDSGSPYSSESASDVLDIKQTLLQSERDLVSDEIFFGDLLRGNPFERSLHAGIPCFIEVNSVNP